MVLHMCSLSNTILFRMWLYRCESADYESAADSLIDWYAAFGINKMWVSDQGSHFKNEFFLCLEKATLCTSLHTSILPLGE